jgi:hypothetical protein
MQQQWVQSMFVFVSFMCLTNDNLFVVYGTWLETAFNLSLAVLSEGAFFIRIAELSGELLTAFLSDRIELKKAVNIGIFLTGISILSDTCTFIALLSIIRRNKT